MEDDKLVEDEAIYNKVFDAGSGFESMGDSKNFKMPSIDEVMKLIDQMQDLSEEEREKLKSELIFPDEQGSEKLRQQMEAAARMAPSSIDYFLFLAMLALIVLVFALFGYKLYKSLMEKEQKKQEKQKNSKKSKKAKQK